MPHGCGQEHAHGHSHGDGHHVHDHSDDIEPALQSLLYQQIEFDQVSTLNEAEVNSGRKVLQKTWAQRLETRPLLASDADEQVLMLVPFAGTVKLHSVLIRSSISESAPKTLKIFINRNDLDFDSANELQPTQLLTLSQTSEVQDIPVKRALFNNVYSLTLLFEDTYGGDVSEIFYVGFKGEFMRLNREPIEFSYEAAANPKDHVNIVGTKDMAESGPRGLQ